MNTRTRSSSTHWNRIAWIALPAALGLPLGARTGGNPDPCTSSALETIRSCKTEAMSALWLARAKCTNLPLDEQNACRRDATAEWLDAIEECAEQLDARRDVCASLGGGIYHPDIDPDDFVPVIDNPYFPLIPGTTFIYQKMTDEGLEQVELTVTNRTKVILGVTCTVIEDVETLDGEVGEDTFDYFAQDVWGNVWYFGELSLSFEDGQISNLGGSWIAGEDGAQPGIIMEANPAVGDFYRQEFLIQEAEDVASVLSLSADVQVDYGFFTDCLQTEDGSPLEPGNVEHKFYAPGVGLVLELDPASGERLELVDIVHE